MAKSRNDGRRKQCECWEESVCDGSEEALCAAERTRKGARHSKVARVSWEKTKRITCEGDKSTHP